MMRALGRRLLERREALGLARLPVAQAARVTWGNLQRYEEGRSLPDLATLISLAGALSITTGRLLQGIERDVER